MRTVRIFFLVITFLSTLGITAQISDLGGIDYTSTIGDGDDPDFNRIRVWVNIPTKLKKKDHFLVNGLRYSNAKINFDRIESFSTTDLEEFHTLEYTLGYTFLLNEKWRFTAQIAPRLTSNLTDNISADDFIINGGIILIRTLSGEKRSRLSLGLTYSQTIGIPAPIPFVTYWREINKNLTYTLGFPITKVKYFFDQKKSSLETFVRIDGYFANLSNDIVIDGNTAESISLSQVIVGLGFDKYYGKHANIFAKAGYTLRNSLRLNEGLSDEVFDFDLSNAFFLRAGFKFNF
ncbi:hypothetical protein GTQ40_16715 [Flavobacteriaceae bacterium R38]|nr:hypothetical protein [Flavobacteriaceae bacterium R38]